MKSDLNVGLDIGSTTIKAVITDQENKIIYKKYRRHFADISGSVNDILKELKEKTENRSVRLGITGSAGMGICERSGIEFIQEVIASCEVVSKNYPDTRTLVDIGGEDSKIVFFKENNMPDIRMNGSCAGGTGSFIDQIATLLGVEVNEMNSLAGNSEKVYRIASRCGVFSKTDVQNLMSRNVSREDIAASVFNAVSLQVISSLSRGTEIKPKIFLCGGPLTFLSSLRKSFIKQLDITQDEVILSENSEVIPAWGTAILAGKQSDAKHLSEYIDIIGRSNSHNSLFTNRTSLPALFDNEKVFEKWFRSKRNFNIPTIKIEDIESSKCFIGIDSGSTTTKIVATDEKSRMFFSFYESNNGSPLDTVTKGLESLAEESAKAQKNLIIAGSCVTGYGEDLIKAAFSLDSGIVETIAHYTAARHFNPDVSFILDIGGQDMKAIFIEKEVIRRLEINEACSSGCGSFIETLAQSINCNVKEFADLACQSEHPCDLGTRCTVFMNSRIKQAFREGASVKDISAGLAYSVVRNCLHKVLKIKDISILGDNIMVQGGTFRNKAVIRAFELETGKNVMITDNPELMGALGACLYSIDEPAKANKELVEIQDLAKPGKYKKENLVCKGCENQCSVTCFRFSNGNNYFAGNKCERFFSSKGIKSIKGINLSDEKYNLIFSHNDNLKGSSLTIGIPRALGFYEDFPFWYTLFSRCGFRVVLSDQSTLEMYEKGINTIMSDNICFPAKLVHGHILNLVGKKVDRIFMPFVVYEKKSDKNTPNSYNCPIVTGYSEVIKSAINTAGKYAIPVDAPSITFKDRNLLKKACKQYLFLISKDIDNTQIEKAFWSAVKAQEDFEKKMVQRCHEVLEGASANNHLVVILAGHPYHTDPLIQHKISEMIAGFGVDVITEDIIRDYKPKTDQIQSVMQWEYINRIIKAAQWASDAPENVNYIELTSFGCGPDAFNLDEVDDILKSKGRIATFIKVDDINNPGSVRLRIRSLIESLKMRGCSSGESRTGFANIALFEKKDRKRKILIPWFSDFYSPFIPQALGLMGYDAENLPKSDNKSQELGLKYSNNEICYPATILVGDYIKALVSGKYKKEEIALAISQTGGQCRATNYIALLKKAMIAAGFKDVPVISVSFGKGILNKQPGFRTKWAKAIKPCLTCMIYADGLSQLYYATAPREREKGSAVRLKEKYIQLGLDALKMNDTESLYSLAEEATNEFMSSNTLRKTPRIGVVGEIFLKYNSFSHKNVINWLISQKIEPVIPPVTEFFTQWFANQRARIEGLVSVRSMPKLAMSIAEKYSENIICRMEKIFQKFPYYRSIGNVHNDAEKASKVININAQFGEGWRIPADIILFAEDGINNVLSLQPFGCIANHIVSKGVEKRLRDIYPSLNLLYLDFDSSTSESNIYNRLYFMIQESFKETAEAS